MINEKEDQIVIDVETQNEFEEKENVNEFEDEEDENDFLEETTNKETPEYSIKTTSSMKTKATQLEELEPPIPNQNNDQILDAEKEKMLFDKLGNSSDLYKQNTSKLKIYFFSKFKD